MPFFIVNIYLCLQCLIPYSSSPIICYPVDANLHYVFNHCCVCSSFSGGLHAKSHMILMEVSQRAYDMIHYISGLFGYFYVCVIHVNLIWYLYLFMLNKFCLSLSLAWCHQAPSHYLNQSTNHQWGLVAFTRRQSHKKCCRYLYLWYKSKITNWRLQLLLPEATELTHWGRDKMVDIFQTTFSNAFSWMKMHEFRLRFHWSLFLRVQSTIFHHWFR